MIIKKIQLNIVINFFVSNLYLILMKVHTQISHQLCAKNCL